jgi:hypothetical protein
MAGPVDVASFIPKASSVATSTIAIALYVIGGIIVLGLLGLFVFWMSRKKRWNLDIEFKLTRSDGKLTNAEWGKGHYNAKKGVVFIRRPSPAMSRWSKGLPVPIFDIRRYVQGSSIITMLQVGPQDFRPVLNDSYTEYVETYKDDKTGEIKQVKESILNIKVDSGLNKAWKSAWESAAKNAYSIRSFLTQFQTPIAIAIVLIACFIGFTILYTKIH